MSSILPGKSDSPKRLASDEEAMVIPENARPSDESPTVISKTPPLVQPGQGSSQQKIADLARKHATPESIVASLRGRRLAHYELIEPIGVGGMAAVIRARDTQLDRFVALKILPPEVAHEKENVQRFHQEAKAAAKLDHENIARAFYCGEDQGLHFIAFEFVEGITLRTMIDQRGRLPVAEAVRYILQIAAGLEHAATRGVVHRDVKPSNVIITPAGRAKLVDMGLARNMERRGEDLTQSGVTLGTFDYISPEQALEPRDADTRSDIYSLGCTFYHLLTGQPPAPEGTPAKKLQHHQHGQPLDPRAIDPAIPDEIVMILGKMMAKNPKDRYQRPIHLLHHLMQVAQKVGAAADIPEGVLLVDAPLPNQQRQRPFLLIGMSLAALVLVTFLLSLAPEPARQINKGEPKVDGTKDIGPLANKKDLPPTKTNGAAGAEFPAVVKKNSDLQALFADPQTREISAGIVGKFDLDQTGLTFHGSSEQKLLLQSSVAGNHATLRYHYQNDSASFGLTLDGGKEVVFRRCKFQIDSDTTPGTAVAAVAIRGGTRQVRFEQCIFAQANDQTMSPEGVPLASVLIDASESPGNARPIVTFERCFFEGVNANGGQAAVAINGPATVNLINCAFKPHGAFVHFRGASTVNNTAVNLQNCAGFVVLGPALRFDANASAQVHVAQSVFATPHGSLVPPTGLPGANLIFLPEGAAVKFDGEQNLYYNLNHMIGRKLGGLIAKTEDYKKYLAQNNGADEKSCFPSNPSDSPWQNPNGPDELAFQLKGDLHGKIGLLNTWRGNMPEAPQLTATKQPTPSKTIVNPDDETRTPGDFKNLLGALSEAKDGDVIYIRHGDDRDVVVPPIQLRPGINVTLRADKTDDFTYQPRFVLDKKYRDNVTSVFKVQEGRLEIEGIEIVLDPDKDRDVAQSIVQVGGAHCVFRNCIFTLRAANDENLSVVSSIDLSSMMKGEMPNGSSGKVEFHECFIRGAGDLVALNGCRLLSVEMENSLVALDGSLLDIRAAGKAMPMSQGVSWRMKRSSVFTTDSVFALRSRFGDVLTVTNAEVEGCLLGSLKPGKSVVNLEGDLELGDYLKWKGERNFYADFERPKEWREKFETKSEVGALTLPKLTDKNLQTLWDAMPAWFKPADAEQERLIQGFGQTAESEKRSLQSLNEPDEP